MHKSTFERIGYLLHFCLPFTSTFWFSSTAFLKAVNCERYLIYLESLKRDNENVTFYIRFQDFREKISRALVPPLKCNDQKCSLVLYFFSNWNKIKSKKWMGCLETYVIFRPGQPSSRAAIYCFGGQDEWNTLYFHGGVPSIRSVYYIHVL